jgi:hypothetical protein
MNTIEKRLVADAIVGNILKPVSNPFPEISIRTA